MRWYQYSLLVLSLLLGFYLITCEAVGQRARLFSSDVELSNSLVQSIYQDRQGMIWIGTEDGLNKYDGNKFTIYKKESSNILSNYVRVLTEDWSGNLLLGYFNGLQVYNHAEDTFTNIPLILQSGSVYGAHVLSIVKRGNGEVWLGTSGHGIFKLHYAEDSIVARQLPGLLPSQYVNRLFEDSHGDLWVSTQDMGLYLLSDNGENHTSFAFSQGEKNYISAICEGSDGTIYAASLDKGLLQYDRNLGDFEPVANGQYTDQAAYSLKVTEDNKVLIGTDGEGLKRYDPIREVITTLNFNVSNIDFTKSKVHEIMQDADGDYWLGLFQKGVVLIPSRANAFQYIGYQSISHNLIGSNYTMSIMADREDPAILWVGTDSDGLYQIRLPEEQLKHYTRDKDANAPQTVISMFQDSMGTFWVGSYIEGLLTFDKSTGKYKKVSQFLNQSGNPISRVTDITEDHNGTLWVTTLGFGAFSMELNTGKIMNYGVEGNAFHPNDATNQMYNAWANCVMVASDNKVYIGTVDGLNIYDPQTKTFQLLNNTNGLFWGKAVHDIHEDPYGNIWIGTGMGLYFFNPQNNDIVGYHTEDGLPSNVICAIEQGGNHVLWISTNHGIAKFNTSTKLFNNYYYHDGIQGNEFSKEGSLVSSEGMLFFSGINGITYFNPKTISPSTDSIKVDIVGFYLQDRAVKKGVKSGNYDIIDTSLMNASTFYLSHEDNSFSIEFSSMEYLNPKRVSYQYSMNGSEWISLQSGAGNVAFNNLKPGKYRIDIRASDFNTYSKVRSVEVVIFPPWYLTQWAKLGYFLFYLALISAIAFYIKQRNEHKRKMQQHLHTRQINEARLEFFTNISHEIRTPLSLIINPIKKLIETDKDTTRQRNYQIIRRNTEKMHHLVNQLMDLRQIDRGKIELKFRETDIVSLVKETVGIFEETLSVKQINFKMRHDSSVPKVWIDPNYFDKTVQNVLSNALKFTPVNGHIEILFEVDSMANQLLISCIDSGVGLEESDLEKVFDRFYQVGNGETDGFGNGIGLHLTRSIMELHHGSIHAENNGEKPGCTFVMHLQLGRAHLSDQELAVPQGDTIHLSDPCTSIVPNQVLVDREPVNPKSRRKVLVVDDDDEVRQYLAEELASVYHVLQSSNGKDGLAMVLSEKPDLIISDVAMPEMDGISFCKKVKHNVNINHIPMILLTARTSESDNLEGLGIGADAYMAKPFNMEILKKTVENIVRNRELLKNNFNGKQTQKDKVKPVDIRSSDEKLLEKLMNIINEHLDNPELNVEMIAAEIGISRVHLYRKLKELTNQSVRDLIRNVRLKQAATLLVSKSLSVSEVAYATGFSTPSKFSGNFKDFYGVSPSVYATREKEKLSD